MENSKCYINSQTSGHSLPDFLNRDNTIFYPETSMSTLEMLNTGRPRDYNIVTDSHLLVGLYSSIDVFLYDQELKEWVNPSMQTYGTSYNLLLNRLWGGATIPSSVRDGKITNVMGHPL